MVRNKDLSLKLLQVHVTINVSFTILSYRQLNTVMNVYWCSSQHRIKSSLATLHVEVQSNTKPDDHDFHLPKLDSWDSKPLLSL